MTGFIKYNIEYIDCSRNDQEEKGLKVSQMIKNI